MALSVASWSIVTLACSCRYSCELNLSSAYAAPTHSWALLVVPKEIRVISRSWKCYVCHFDRAPALLNRWHGIYPPNAPVSKTACSNSATSWGP
ncbi:hypothetical protein F5Y01DRAFT_230982 [Xylaria sp. FL0043]|nr:hypothetical protein F5Y01DRAFT_230982 [Xylaria sp. FL0043]